MASIEFLLPEIINCKGGNFVNEQTDRKVPSSPDALNSDMDLVNMQYQVVNDPDERFFSESFRFMTILILNLFL